MKFKLLAILAGLLMSIGVVMAGDSGLYFNPDREGEGMNLTRSGDTMVIYLFTFGQEYCYESNEVLPSPLPPDWPIVCTSNQQRWFYAVNTLRGDVVSGIMYVFEADSYPAATANSLGDEKVVGTYTMVRDGDGWLLSVTKFGPVLAAEDPLFADIFDFSTLLLEATD